MTEKEQIPEQVITFQKKASINYELRMINHVDMQLEILQTSNEVDAVCLSSVNSQLQSYKEAMSTNKEYRKKIGTDGPKLIAACYIVEKLMRVAMEKTYLDDQKVRMKKPEMNSDDIEAAIAKSSKKETPIIYEESGPNLNLVTMAAIPSDENTIAEIPPEAIDPLTS